VLCYRPGTLRLRISDDGRSARPDVVLGHGIVGMWQRASLLGGELSVATRTVSGSRETGFQITAHLPLDGHGR
jgi:signal transduction histidine kinase